MKKIIHFMYVGNFFFEEPLNFSSRSATDHTPLGRGVQIGFFQKLVLALNRTGFFHQKQKPIFFIIGSGY
ncbi:hypothetical protein Hdeb2414_s1095g00981731 [Helianthus debilis subsp. tardiflorus]